MSKEICPNCQAEVKKGASYCHECGTELKAIETKRSLTDVTKQDEFTGYIQITAVVEIALGILVLLYAFVASEEAFKTEYSQYFVDYLQIILVIIGLLLILFGFSSIYFGTKLFQLKQIGRIGTMIVAALFLIFLPFSHFQACFWL